MANYHTDEDVFTDRTGPNTVAIDTSVKVIGDRAGACSVGEQFDVSSADLPVSEKFQCEIISLKLWLQGVTTVSMHPGNRRFTFKRVS